MILPCYGNFLSKSCIGPDCLESTILKITGKKLIISLVIYNKVLLIYNLLFQKIDYFWEKLIVGDKKNIVNKKIDYFWE